MKPRFCASKRDHPGFSTCSCFQDIVLQLNALLALFWVVFIPTCQLLICDVSSRRDASSGSTFPEPLQSLGLGDERRLQRHPPNENHRPRIRQLVLARLGVRNEERLDVCGKCEKGGRNWDISQLICRKIATSSASTGRTGRPSRIT